MTGAYLPGVRLRPIRMGGADLLAPNAEAWAWEKLMGVSVVDETKLILLPDPFTFDIGGFLGGLDGAFPEACKIGGLASGGQYSGANGLFLGDRLHRGGLVGLAMSGDLTVETVVAQGCRPIGQPMFVTSAERNVIKALDGEPAAIALQRLHKSLDPADQELARKMLFLGVVMRGADEHYGAGDFLIRDILGLDPSSGAIQVGALVGERHVVQFHVRDARTSAQELADLLASGVTGEPAGALLFSCLGRGEGLYGVANHDSDLYSAKVGNNRLGGFFCNGEIGPVQGATYLHGYTSSFGLFRSASTRRVAS